MPRLSKEDKEAEQIIMRDFEMTRMSISVIKCTKKITHQQILEKLEQEKEIIAYLQNNCYDLKPTEIRYFFNHSKFDLVLAHDFLKRLYYQDTNKRVNGMFIKTAIRFKAWYDEKFKMEKVG